jgi:biotin transport system substrate-specific component
LLQSTYSDMLRPRQRLTALGYDATLVVGGSLLIALSAYLKIQLPFSPVPITGQTLAVLLVGASLGWKKGGMSVLTYLAEGLLGLPVFAGGASGPAYLLGPTGGYLLGFVLAALAVGWLAERGWDRQVGLTLLAMSIGSALIYLPGLAWLSVYVGVDQALPLGLYPFLIGDAIKLLLAGVLLPGGWLMLQNADQNGDE